MTAQSGQIINKVRFEQLLPAFCRGRIVVRVMVLAQALAILLALATDVSSDFWARLGLTSLFVHWVALLTVALLCRFQRRLYKVPPQQLAALALLLLLVVTLGVSTAAFSMLHTSGWQQPSDFTRFLLQTLLIALLVGVMGIQLFALYVEHSWRLTAQSRSELDALQARIRPHFLFNSLNTVAELTQQDPAAAEKALLDLASLFRAALNAGVQVELQEELALTRQYLALEQWRLGSRLQLEWLVPDDLPHTLLPCLTLQPLLENAVRHGIERCSKPGVIRFELHQSARYLTIVLTNPAGDLPPAEGGNGMALQNIRRRLELQFGDDAKLSTGVNQGEYRVKLVIPLTKVSA
jgi:two-component system, LytTR family, sensor histidine kinase AlgZ